MSSSGRSRRVLAALLSLLLTLGLLALAGSAEASSPPGHADASAPADDLPAPAAAQARYQPADCATATAADRNASIPVAHCFAMGYTDASGEMRSAAAGPPASALTPAQLQDAYKLPDGGAGMTVAIVDAYGYSNAEADLSVFRDHYGLAPCTTANGCFTTIDQRGGTDFPADNAGWSIEAALDIDAVSSVCPRCKILLVQADSASMLDLGTAANTAANQPGVVAVSNSYGIGGENSGQGSFDKYYDHPGVAITASTGDTGNIQSFPATSKTVVSVGGTRLVKDASARGWTESAWGVATGGDGAGSGCSLYEATPDWQKDVPTTCGARKATADISADADPVSGLGIYNSAAAGGWAQYGGTSLASPLVAGMYALAGKPTPGTYPASYPYAASGQLFDVTTGVNGPCGTKLCQAGAGWDGPTGLGTPNGVAALTEGETGDVVGKVSESGSGAGIAGTTVTATDAAGASFSAVTEADGSYDVHARTGTYTVKAAKFGYLDGSVEDVTVSAGQQVTQDFTLTKLPSRTVSGSVTDASGHGWPMRARITVDGHPDSVAYSDPYTGGYSISLPTGEDYTLHAASADLPGYATATVPVDLTGDASATNTDIGLAVANPCTAPGYGFVNHGAGADFTGWTAKTPQGGWTIADNKGNGQTWSFDDAGHHGNVTGGSGNFAVMDSMHYGTSIGQDTSLVSPPADLSAQDDPKLTFNTRYYRSGDQTGNIDISIDGGASWSTIWTADKLLITGPITIPLPQAAHQSDVRVRFHFTGALSGYWELDDVVIGKRLCDPSAGGLVAGVVRDDNTDEPLNGATVTSRVDATEGAVTVATPEDANVPDGYYWLYSSHTGGTGFDVAEGKYMPAQVDVEVPSDSVVHSDIRLGAGHLTVDKATVEVTEQLGKSTGTAVTFGNDGTEPVHVKLGEADRGFTPLGAAPGSASGAPTQLVKAPVSVANPALAATSGAKSGAADGSLTVRGQQVQLGQAGPADDAWQSIANYPRAIMDDAVAYYDGKAYVVGGADGASVYAEAHSYDPATKSWSRLADLPEPVNGAAAGFIGDKLYVVGGWDTGGGTTKHGYVYDIDANSWSAIANLPVGLSGAGVAVLQGKLYVVGGCTSAQCAPTSDAVFSYDPVANSWTKEASYPNKVAFGACGGVAGEVVCAGGDNADTGTALTETYSLTPGASEWTKRADLPMDAWGASAASGNGEFEVIGGVVNKSSALTNQGYVYDPAADEWTALPNANRSVYRAGASCGLYRVGGSTGSFNTTAAADVLPGFEDCGGGDVTWLSESPTEFDVPPGKSVTITVTADSAATAQQPGDYAATVRIANDTPYRTASIGTTMHVTPPSSWGKIAGTVSGPGGTPLSGATVQICTTWDQRTGCGAVTYTFKTDASGHYQLWLDKDYSPLGVIAAKDGYQPLFKVVRIKKGATATADFTLSKG